MNKRSLFILMVSIIISVCITAHPVWAGNVQRNRWEGVAIGIGAAILGKVIFDHVHQHHNPHYGPSGHWEIRKVWVSPVFERVWNPGHYNRRGRWVPGGWIRIEKCPGYWKEERIWISERTRAAFYR